MLVTLNVVGRSAGLVQRTAALLIAACLVASSLPVRQVNSQEPNAALDSVPAPRRFGVQAGFGNIVSGMGLSGEYFVRDWLSAVGGVGFIPETSEGPGNLGGGVAVRGFTPGIKHRGFLELSFSLLEMSWNSVLTFQGLEFINVERRYGPALSAGYHYTAAGGFTLIVSLGAGVTIDGGKAAPSGTLGFGYTWR